MRASTPLLELAQVTKDYQAAQGLAPVRVLNGITLEVTRGESLAIIGPSGSGKSTLLNIIGTLDQPTSGQVRLDGVDLAGLEENRLAALRNQHIGFVFQSHHLLPHCTALENVLVPTLATKAPGPQDGGDGGESAAKRAARLLDRVGLGGRLNHRPGQLSGGERQRVAVVRALINQPELLLADEPTGALDRAAAAALGQLLVELNQEEHVTVIMVTHALDLARRMSRVLELEAGSLRAAAENSP